MHKITVLDLNFLGMPGTIASFLIPHSSGVILVESGPGSTKTGLTNGLKEHGYQVSDVTHVFLTHIHLDHAGAAGWLAGQGAQIFVHEVGAPHMIDPSKLLASASRIYGDKMDFLWGEFLPVPEHKLTVLHDGEEVNIGSLCLRAINTPGHANHHFAYAFEKTLFSGDIGGVRLSDQDFIAVPMPPPEFHLETWRASIARLLNEDLESIAPTHFGIHNDFQAHLEYLSRNLDKIEAWMEKELASNPDSDKVQRTYIGWVNQLYREEGLEQDQIAAYETANPSYMSATGILRYWNKYRSAPG